MINLLPGGCDNYLYQKSDGSLKCSYVIDHGLPIKQAAIQCAQNNAIIPELPNPNDQQMINIIRVLQVFYYALIVFWKKIIECCVKKAYVFLMTL